MSLPLASRCLVVSVLLWTSIWTHVSSKASMIDESSVHAADESSVHAAYESSVHAADESSVHAADESSVHAALLEVLTTLGWQSVIVFYEGANDTDTSQTVLPALHRRGVRTVLLTKHCSPWTQCLGRVQGIGKFLLLGSYSFKEDILNTTLLAKWSLPQSTDEWLTVVEEEDTPSFDRLAARFSNLVFISRAKTSDLRLWTVRHQGRDSRVTLVSRLEPGADHQLNRETLLPNLQHALQGRTLRVTFKEYKPDFFHTATTTSNGTVTEYFGILKDLLDYMADVENFSYVFVPSLDNSWGQLKNGQWDGPIGMLTRKEADLALTRFAVNQARNLVADSLVCGYAHVVVTYRVQSESLRQGGGWYFFLRPLAPDVYVLAGASMLGLVLLLTAFDWLARLSVPAERTPREPLTPRTCLRKVSYNLLLTVAALLNRVPEAEMGSRAGRVLMSSWLLLSVVLGSLYGSKLTSTLAVPKESPPFATLSDFLKQNTVTWGVPGGTAEEAFLQQTDNAQLQKFFSMMKVFNESDPDVFSDYDTQKEKMFRGNYACFTWRSVYQSWAKEMCDIHKLPEVYIATPTALYMQKGSPYFHVLSKHINTLVETGLMQHWTDKWTQEKQHCGHKDMRTKPILLADIQNCFLLVAIGLAVATAVLAIEFGVKLYRV